MSLHVAVYESEYLARESLRAWLVARGYRVTVLDTGSLTRNTLRSLAPDVLFLDADSRLVGIRRLVAVAGDLLQGACVVPMAGRGSLPRAIRTIDLGAFDFIEKPLDPETLNALMTKIVRHLELRAEMRTLRARLDRRRELEDFVGHNHEIERISAQLEVIGACELSVLITGEKGTGKTLLARLIHKTYGGNDDAFVQLDCQALQGELLSACIASELAAVGPSPEAGARCPRSFCFVGIEHLSPENLAFMARLVDERRVLDPETGELRPLEARIITTARASVEVLVEERAIPRELAARIGVIRFHLPPLRERGIDTLLIAEHLLKRFNREHERVVKGFDLHAKRVLLDHEWTGNVRELMAVVEQAVVLCDGDQVGIRHLPGHLNSPPGLGEDGCPHTLREIDHAWILRTIDATGGNKSKAARLLGINRATLYKKLKELEAAAPEGG